MWPCTWEEERKKSSSLSLSVRRYFRDASSRSYLLSHKWALASQPTLGTRGQVSILIHGDSGERGLLKRIGGSAAEKEEGKATHNIHCSHFVMIYCFDVY